MIFIQLNKIWIVCHILWNNSTATGWFMNNSPGTTFLPGPNTIAYFFYYNKRSFILFENYNSQVTCLILIKYWSQIFSKCFHSMAQSSLKYWFTLKWTFCHHLLSFMLFQIHMNFFLPQKTKGEAVFHALFQAITMNRV